MKRLRLGLGFSDTGKGFDPGQLSGLAAWWRSDIGVVTSGGAVSTWTDNSGNALVLTPSGPNVFHAVDSDFSNHPSVEFSGNGFLQNTGFTISQPNTIILVGRFTSLASTATQNEWLIGSSGPIQIIFASQTSTDLAIYAGTIAASTQAADLNPHVWAAVMNGASSFLYQDHSGAPLLSNANPGSGALTSLDVGGISGGLLTGKVTEVIITGAAASASDLGKLFSQYISPRYGFSAN